MNSEENSTTVPIFKAKQTKDRIKLDINIAGMNNVKVAKINEAIKKLIE